MDRYLEFCCGYKKTLIFFSVDVDSLLEFECGHRKTLKVECVDQHWGGVLVGVDRHWRW